MGTGRLLTFLMFCSIALGVFSSTAPIPPQKASYEEIFQAVWKAVNDNFYDPDFAGVDWQAVRRRYQPLATRIASDRDFYDLITRMLKEIPVSHLGLVMPARQTEGGIGVQTHTIEGLRIVTAVAPASDAQRQGLRLGDVILSPAQQEIGPIGTTATLRVKGCDSGERNLEVRREGAWWPPERPSLRWRSIETEPGKRIGYLRAIRFDDDAAPLADAAMSVLKNTVGLIVDIRDNGGGNISYIRLGSYFSRGSHLVVALLTRPYLARLRSAPAQIDPGAIPKASGVYTTAAVIQAMRANGGAVALMSEDLGDQFYRGKVVVLVNERTGSAAEGFAWDMKEKAQATLIGRTTAGALLGAEAFPMPGGWELRVPTHAGYGPDGRAGIDKAVSSHITVRWTSRDVCEGRDPDIAKALDVLSSSK